MDAHRRPRTERDRGLLAALARATALEGMRLARVGLVVGVLAGWVGLLRGHGRDAAVGAHAAPWYRLLVVALPAMVVLRALPARSGAAGPDGPEPAGMRRRGAVLLGATAVIGWAAGTVLFLVLAILVPAVVGIRKLDPIAVRRALLDHLSWPAVWTAGLLTVGAAVAVAAAKPVSSQGKG